MVGLLKGAVFPEKTAKLKALACWKFMIMMSDRSKANYLNLYSLKKSIPYQSKANPKDRRSGIDRRKAYSARYFEKGGIDRRGWKERRYLWYQTF